MEPATEHNHIYGPRMNIIIQKISHNRIIISSEQNNDQTARANLPPVIPVFVRVPLQFSKPRGILDEDSVPCIIEVIIGW